MNIYDLSNKDLASTLELIAQNETTETIFVYGFSDNRDTRYKALRFIQEAASRLSRMENEKSEEKKGIKTIGFPSKEAIRIAQAVEDGLIQPSNFAKYGNWKAAYLAFCQANGIQNVKDGFKWLYNAEE